VLTRPADTSAALWRWLLLPVSLAGGWLLWEVLARLSGFPSFILPLPGQVWARFVEVAASGQLAFHTAVTLSEVLARACAPKCSSAP
jgi:NitT/TauT family transport system permease protein